MNRRRSAVAALAFASAAAFAGLGGEAAVAQNAATATASASVKRADLRGTSVSREVQHVADWAVHSGDHQRLPFIIVDKVNAKALAFDAGGRLLQTTPVLLGMGVGDAFPPGVVNMDMHETQPWQRITPAGRFVAEEGVNLKGQSVLWVDYDNAIAIHRLPARRTSQKRHERIVSRDAADHRITYGCINVAPAFYDQVVLRHFRQRGGVVYVLPDTLPLKNVLKTYDVGSQPVATPVQHAVREAPVAARQRF
jgi:hypothetical protein